MRLYCIATITLLLSLYWSLAVCRCVSCGWLTLYICSCKKFSGAPSLDAAGYNHQLRTIVYNTIYCPGDLTNLVLSLCSEWFFYALGKYNKIIFFRVVVRSKQIESTAAVFRFPVRRRSYISDDFTTIVYFFLVEFYTIIYIYL